MSLFPDARILDINRYTVLYHLRKKTLTWNGIINKLSTFRHNRADILTYKQSVLLNSVTTDKVKEASLRDTVVCYGILQDKERDLRGHTNQSGNQVQVNISFDPGLIPGSGGNITLEVPAAESQQAIEHDTEEE